MSPSLPPWLPTVLLVSLVATLCLLVVLGCSGLFDRELD